jgi:hypothetical protein
MHECESLEIAGCRKKLAGAAREGRDDEASG